MVTYRTVNGRWVGGRFKYDVATGSKKVYKKFKESHPKEDIAFNQYKEILQALNEYYIDYMLDTGNLIIFPYGLGKMGVNKYKKNGHAVIKNKNATVKYAYHVNHAETRKFGKMVYYLSEHTEGYLYNYKWFRDSSKIKSSDIWGHKMCKHVSKKLSERLLDPLSDCAQMYRETSTRRVSEMYYNLCKEEDKKLNNG